MLSLMNFVLAQVLPDLTVILSNIDTALQLGPR
jgi:hypothetical protein